MLTIPGRLRLRIIRLLRAKIKNKDGQTLKLVKLSLEKYCNKVCKSTSTVNYQHMKITYH